VVPLTDEPPKVITVEDAPLHNTSLAGCVTDGEGLTVMVKVFDGPVQVTPPFKILGVTVIVAVMGNELVLIALNEVILPVPVDASPMAMLLLAHE